MLNGVDAVCVAFIAAFKEVIFYLQYQYLIINI